MSHIHIQQVYTKHLDIFMLKKQRETDCIDELTLMNIESSQ